MNTHVRGCLLALVTTFFWGTLPIALKAVTEQLDPFTIVWLRFTAAALWVWLWPLPGKHRESRPLFRGQTLILFGLASLMLGANFVLYNSSAIYLSAPATQIVSQMGPLVLMLGGVLVLHEPFRAVQGLGGLTLTVGLLLFFNERLHELLHFGEGYGLGLLLGLSGSFVWAVYGIAQKALMKVFSPEATLRVIYACVALGLTPLAHPWGILQLDGMQCFCLAYCCLNTIVAYGCFSRALAVWHTAGVGAVLSLTPLFTLACAWLAHRCFPASFPNAPLNLLGYAGALIVVLGAALLAVGPQVQGALQRWREN